MKNNGVTKLSFLMAVVERLGFNLEGYFEFSFITTKLVNLDIN
jgi:hypothetical protein